MPAPVVMTILFLVGGIIGFMVAALLCASSHFDDETQENMRL